MLLGTMPDHNNLPQSETLVIQLIMQQRYAEVYELLVNQQPMLTAGLYNLALCLHWSGNYKEALSRLDSIQLAPMISNANNFTGNSVYTEIKNKQNQTDDYLQGMSEIYIKRFPVLVNDAIVRLKTDCWLQLGDYEKVMAIATPIANKGYKNIIEALKIAGTADVKRI